MAEPTKLNLTEGACKKCGVIEYITDSGLCLKCVTDRILKGGNLEAKVIIQGVSNLKVTTGVTEDRDGEGNLILITKVQFESNAKPQELTDILRLMAAGRPVSAMFGSPQAVMAASREEGAFAQK